MTMGVVAIAGIPPWAGFFSKDEILYQTFSSPNPIGKLLWLVGLITAGMTSFYMFRLWFKTFFGPEHFDELAAEHSTSHAGKAEHDEGQASHSHGVHESPWIMLAPLVLLAILSVVGGWVGVPAALGGHNEIEHFLSPVFATAAETTGAVTESTSHGLELGLAAVSVLTALAGFGLAYVFYYKKPGTAAALAKKAPALYRVVENKFYVDEIYHAGIVTPLLMFTRMILGGLVDGGIVNGSGSVAGATTRGLSSLTRRIQSGNIRSYAGWLALGAAALIAVMIFGRMSFDIVSAVRH
jgi:NADH-quinone oxidoreductase subunit L